MNFDTITGQLRIYVGESDRVHGHAVYDWIITQAKERGLAGATAVRGLIGYGPQHRTIHSFKIEHLALDLPVIIEIIDSEDRLQAFLGEIEAELPAGLLFTLQTVRLGML